MSKFPDRPMKANAKGRVLFARLGWMKRYEGPQQQLDYEKPVGGGAYTEEHFGTEGFNFRRIEGRVFGFFQPAGHNLEVRLEKIEPRFNGDKLDDVLVIFVAPPPKGQGERIVGWYRHATVHRRPLPPDERRSRDCDRLLREAYRATGKALFDRRGNEFDYLVETDDKSAVLVREEQRSFKVPTGKGGFGEADVCYAYDEKGREKPQPWITEALNYVSSYQPENVAPKPQSELEIAATISGTMQMERAAGFQGNPRIRTAIEKYAMERAREYLEKHGLKPVDEHRAKKGYDFRCTTPDGAELYVEVKGTQTLGEKIVLTRGEVNHAREHKNSALFIVHSIHRKGSTKNPKLSNGEDRFLNPWNLPSETLQPIT